MKQSLLFVPTLRELPKDAEISSHIILLKGGYIKQHVAGVYTYLPLAYRIMKKIEKVIREELDNIGCTELLMPTLQSKESWVESGRWENYGKELMRMKDRHDREFCLGPTHEEVISTVVRDSINSYKKLPLAIYQIQTKFRDEFRPRFGLMRGREFIMKDLYTFHSNEKDLDDWYLKVRQAYINILNRFDLHFAPVSAASGQIGGNSSEEFMVLCEKGEDTIAFSTNNNFASNVELCNLKEGDVAPDGGIIKYAKGIEVGHIFKLGTKYSEPMNVNFIDVDGVKKPVIMGCYGMGISRLLMAILEQHNEDLKVLWPDEIAPFKIHIICLDKVDTETYKIASKLYQDLENKGYEVLFDDRSESAGVKFNDADLIGIKNRIIVGRGAVNGMLEVKNMEKKTTEEVSLSNILEYDFD